MDGSDPDMVGIAKLRIRCTNIHTAASEWLEAFTPSD